jgi:hypothetical protein
MAAIVARPACGWPHPQTPERRSAQRPRACDLVPMSTWAIAEADTAFSREARARRFAALRCIVRTLGRCCRGLHVFDQPASGGRALRREIALDEIAGTLEPNRAAEFDCSWRPSGPARGRWRRIWMAEARGTVLPPISVVAVGGGYAIRDGHHRVSVARARGALTIDALVA